jgi:hypothetical protein
MEIASLFLVLKPSPIVRSSYSRLLLIHNEGMSRRCPEPTRMDVDCTRVDEEVNRLEMKIGLQPSEVLMYSRRTRMRRSSARKNCRTLGSDHRSPATNSVWGSRSTRNAYKGFSQTLHICRDREGSLLVRSLASSI